MLKKINHFIPLILVLTALGQLVPLSFIGLDLSELQMEWTLQNAFEVYNSQRIYLFSSIATPLVFILLAYQVLKIKNQKLFFQNILNGLPELVIVLNKNLEVLFKNASFLNYNLELSIKDLFNQYMHKPFFEISLSVDDEKVYFLGSFSHFDNGHILILKDVTELKRSETIIKEQEKQISRSGQLASLGEMASGIAHEINNPLGVIVANVEIIRMLLPEGTEKIKKCLETIDRMIGRMTGIIKAMKRLSRIDNEDSVEKINLEELFSDVMSICQITIKKYEVDLTFSIDDFKGKFVSGSTVQLSQVFINLINNACHAVEILEEKWLKIEIHEENKVFKIFLTNSGPQIPKEIQQKIFQPFFTTKDPGKGTGLGLSLSKSILELHKGNLILDGENDSPRFIVELPNS